MVSGMRLLLVDHMVFLHIHENLYKLFSTYSVYMDSTNAPVHK